jgi:hypothetical protein
MPYAFGAITTYCSGTPHAITPSRLRDDPGNPIAPVLQEVLLVGKPPLTNCWMLALWNGGWQP